MVRLPTRPSGRSTSIASQIEKATVVLVLARYGCPFEQAHVAFFLGLTPLCCLFCLMHLRAAAFVLALVTIVPSLIFFALSGNHVLFAIAINLALVLAIMMAILVRNSVDFDELVQSRREASLREEAARSLSEANGRPPTSMR